LIKQAIVPLSQSPEFISFLSTLEHPAIAMLFGVLFTAVLQSSSSSVVIFQAFTAQGLLTFDITVYLVIGAAIGSVAPNLLASLTTNRNGKRTAILNLLFNLIRAAIIILLINLFPPFLEFIRNLTPNSVGRQVANAHTIFAILAVLIEFPLAGLIVSMAKKIIPMKEEESRQLENRQLKYLNHLPEVLPSSVALQQSRREIARMGHITLNSIREAIDCFFEPDEKKITDVLETEESVDILTDAISQRLVALRARDYGPKDVYQLSQMMMIVSDIERISDHAENLVEYAEQLQNKKAVISETGRNELKRLAKAAWASLEMSLDIFENEKYDLLPEMEALEQNVDDLQVEVINNHVQRLMIVACDPMGGVIFTDVATDLERCSDHALNIATALAKIPEDL
ncbi:MAG: Na/Pi cotransporter family protein, partial [Lachnospiraceae bacterium]|nr:Na/Pi cotransporter family protein [Lachnospiraceae bacterium]